MALNKISSSTNQLAAMLKRPSLSDRMFKADISDRQVSDVSAKASSNVFADKFDESKTIRYDADKKQSVRESMDAFHSASVELLKAVPKDRNAFISSVKAFAESYNGLIDNTESDVGGSENSSGLMNITRSYSSALEKAGISVNDDRLSVNEKVMSDNIRYAKSMFNGKYSYGDKIVRKASDMKNSFDFSNPGIYNRSGIFMESKY